MKYEQRIGISKVKPKLRRVHKRVEINKNSIGVEMAKDYKIRKLRKKEYRANPQVWDMNCTEWITPAAFVYKHRARFTSWDVVQVRTRLGSGRFLIESKEA